ncbi:CLUMA_CG011356, isoform A [Clunio marinus]|uniref:CLUMA_CG011356, isoform A n=1 Tax=Clunio marinus TaxID=568069 RepID=A0A1J1ICM3_9DIPT|nr:CLUMA_CG011356, isoform A [Clunio marinus]
MKSLNFVGLMFVSFLAFASSVKSEDINKTKFNCYIDYLKKNNRINQDFPDYWNWWFGWFANCDAIVNDYLEDVYRTACARIQYHPKENVECAMKIVRNRKTADWTLKQEVVMKSDRPETEKQAAIEQASSEMDLSIRSAVTQCF